VKITMTNVLIAINVIVYIWEVLSGTQMESFNSLVSHGALYGQLVLQGQWWRIFTGSFMHAGIWHIALNMFALYQLGTFVEYALGRWRMLAVYLISLVGGGIAVVVFAPNDPTVGASGAIFGLFGALFAIGVRLGRRGRALIMQTLPILLLNLAFTFAIPFISKAGHLGGLFSGFVAGLVLFMTRRPAFADAGVEAAEEAAGEPPESEQSESERPEIDQWADVAAPGEAHERP